jgi:iron complex outermembrane receptor protein
MTKLLITLPALLICGFYPAAAQQDEGDEKRLETITISADRFASAESLRAVSAETIGAEDIARTSITRADDLSSLSASLTQRSIFGSSAPQFFIRGVGSNDINPTANPGIAIYEDDVFIASPLGQNLAFFDIAGASIYKGPQGTLFGRNATGGAIVVQTRSPGETPGGDIRASAGDNSFRGVEAAYDTGRFGPVALRISGMARNSDGFTTNAVTGNRVNGLDEWGFRVRGDLDLNGPWGAAAMLELGADRSEMTAHQGLGLFAPESLGPGSVPGICNPDRIAAGSCVNLLGYNYSSDPYTVANDRPTEETLDVTHGSIVVTRDGPVRFKSVTAIRVANRNILEDADASPLSIANLDFLNESEAISQEFNLKAQAGPLSWTSGLFFLDDQLTTANRYDNLGQLRQNGVTFSPVNFFLGPFRLQQDYAQTVSSAAIYGEVDWLATSALTLTAGLRYTREETDFETSTVFREALPDTTLSPRRAGSVDDEALSWRLAGSWAFAEDRYVFVSASRGFRSSSFNGGALFPADTIGPVEPEEITAVEAGVSWQWASGLSSQVSAFQYAYDGLQDFTFRPNPPPTRQVLDSADAGITGMEANFAWKGTFGLSADISLALLDATYTDFIDANGIDRNGARLTATPETALRVSAQYERAIGSDFGLTLAVDLDHRSEIYFDSSNSALLSSPQVTLLRTRVLLVDRKRGLELALEASNITNEAVLVDALNISEYGLIQQTYGAPRQVFLSVSKSY